MRGVGQLYDQALAPAGINAAQYNLLKTVEKLGAPTQSELAADIVMNLSALGHTLKPLIRDGWVLLDKDPADGRRRLITLSPNGRAKLKEAQRLWKPTQRRFERVLGANPTKELLALLDHLASQDFNEAFADRS
ncbi:transcriptional regulator MarR family [Caballeronia insecticola]|uniref:Transcriptional regulator MarR family n=2 Tax=Caballeronia insecticola TaxID=758793 RepID=R4WPD0_9BURK|nr:transcriptional regulator MarR family [Caballeronia insecticola]